MGRWIRWILKHLEKVFKKQKVRVTKNTKLLAWKVSSELLEKLSQVSESLGIPTTKLYSKFEKEVFEKRARDVGLTLDERKFISRTAYSLFSFRDELRINIEKQHPELKGEFNDEIGIG